MAKYNVEVELSGTDSNAHMSIGLVRKALLNAVSPDAANEFMRDVDACASYDDLMSLIFDTVEVL